MAEMKGGRGGGLTLCKPKGSHIAMSINTKGHCFHVEVLGRLCGPGGESFMGWNTTQFSTRGGKCRALLTCNRELIFLSISAFVIVRCLDMHAQTHRKTH